MAATAEEAMEEVAAMVEEEATVEAEEDITDRLNKTDANDIWDQPHQHM